jgi:hypothetical protein
LPLFQFPANNQRRETSNEASDAVFHICFGPPEITFQSQQ